ncbi:hypothetical protein [Bdellovibrio sp. HCB2-146]|uniref:hypothetical protein n=1 Tax=Bdellovibrio sp. HCB2-146 TaxID=3394362 RepID=UPI0039BCB1AB
MKNFKLYFMFIITLGFVLSCAPEKKTAALESPSTDSDQFPSVDSPLYVQFSTRWESDDDGDYTVHGLCSIDSLAPVGTVDNTCTVAIPEAQLYFSDLRFTVGTHGNSGCSQIVFSPYYYRRTNSSAFTNPGSTEETNCDKNHADWDGDKAKCYGGAAPAMIPSFPVNKGSYFLTFLTLADHYILPAENTTRWYQGFEAANLAAANDLTDRATVINTGVRQHTAEEFEDYQVECRNLWGETLYRIEFKVKDEDLDEDPSNPAGDQFTDWDKP